MFFRGGKHYRGGGKHPRSRENNYGRPNKAQKVGASWELTMPIIGFVTILYDTLIVRMWYNHNGSWSPWHLFCLDKLQKCVSICIFCWLLIYSIVGNDPRNELRVWWVISNCCGHFKWIEGWNISSLCILGVT